MSNKTVRAYGGAIIGNTVTFVWENGTKDITYLTREEAWSKYCKWQNIYQSGGAENR